MVRRRQPPITGPRMLSGSNQRTTPPPLRGELVLAQIPRHMRIDRRTVAKYLERAGRRRQLTATALASSIHSRKSWPSCSSGTRTPTPRCRPAIEASKIRRRFHHHQGLLAHSSQERRRPPLLTFASNQPRRTVRCGLGPLRRVHLQLRNAQACAFCLMESHSRKIYLKLKHSQTSETFLPLSRPRFSVLLRHKP